MAEGSEKRRLLIAALLSGLAVVLLYWVAVHTEVGQRLDNHIFESRKTEPLAVREDATRLLHTISYTTLPILTGVVTLLAWSVGGWRRALAAGAAIGGAVLTSEILKHGLPRPGLIDIDLFHLTHNSFPSGHATIALSLGLARISAVPARVRPLAALLAVLLAAAFGVATVIGGWHRPSDTLAGYLIAFGWACVIALTMRSGPVSGTCAVPSSRARRWCRQTGAALLLGWLGLVLMLLLEFEFGEAQLMAHHELRVALAVIVVTALALVRWWLARQAGIYRS